VRNIFLQNCLFCFTCQITLRAYFTINLALLYSITTVRKSVINATLIILIEEINCSSICCNWKKSLLGQPTSRFRIVCSTFEAVNHALATFGEIHYGRVSCVKSIIGFFRYESDLRLHGLVFKVGDVNIGEGMGSLGHSVNYMLRRASACYFIYLK
jgi:hypothetical protein